LPPAPERDSDSVFQNLSKLCVRDLSGDVARPTFGGVEGHHAQRKRSASMRIDYPVRRGKRLLALLDGAGLLGLEAILKGQGVETSGLAVENMLGEPAHVRRDGEVRAFNADFT
jgi:hypothetical protein